MDNTRSQNLETQKERIKQFIEVNGPSLPVHISGHLKLDSMIAGAFLADLLADKELKISNLRVGNSPLYFLRGQEFQLEKFANYLPGKEREAFHLLKENLILNDKLMLPAIRVALRAIKDYALPLEYGDDLYWRFMKVNEGLAVEMINEGKADFRQLPGIEIKNSPEIVKENKIEIKPLISVEKVEPKIEVLEIPVLEEPKLEVQEIKKDVEEIKEAVSLENPIEELKQEKDIEIIKENKIRKVKVKEKPEFIKMLIELLQKENYAVENEKFKKKDYSAILVENGKRYLCIGKDKKVITESDIMGAVKSGQKLKMPVVFAGNGEPNKKALDWIEYFGDILKFKRVEKVSNIV
jgi:CBS domain-containing protein